MSALVRDRQFATFVETHRAVLQRCAFLLVGERAASDTLVSATLADLYGRWLRTATPLRDAYRLLYTTDPAGLRLPWDRRARFELLDTGPVREPVEPVVSDLARLPPEQRLVLVLERVALLPSVEIAAVLDCGVDDVLALSRTARATLVTPRPERVADAYLAAELAEAVPHDLRAVASADDLAHGRTMARRRWTRRGLVAAAALVVLVLGLTQVRAQQPTPSAAPSPVVTVTATPGSNAACDKTEPVCQASLVRAWRAQMVELVVGYLDPEGTYFNASSFYPRDESDDLWTTKEGALAVEVFRLDGSTEIYLQIATDRVHAARCGTLTDNPCTSTRFMDGNRFTLSDSRNTDGIEAQYRPEGKDVITVVSREVGPGKKLAVERGDLVRLLQDKNLRLPEL